MDSGTFLEKLLLANTRNARSLKVKLVFGNSPEKLFRAKERVLKVGLVKRQDEREPIRLLSDRIMSTTSIFASHSGNVPSSWFSLKSKYLSPFCEEIQYEFLLQDHKTS